MMPPKDMSNNEQSDRARFQTEKKEFFIVGRYVKGESPEVSWVLQGVFDKMENAVRHCRNDRYFVVPLKLNEPLAENLTKMQIYWPKQDIWTEK